jgi:hypothetical protein
MRHLRLAVCLLVLFGLVGCGKADRALDAVDKAKAMRNDIANKAAEVEKDVRSKVDRAMEKERKRAEIEPSTDDNSNKEKEKGNDNRGKL